MLEFKNALVTEIRQETSATRRFFLKVEASDSVFLPGQFITFDLPISEKKNKRLRSYSIANAPNNNGIIELVIVLMQDGLGTNYLFKEVKVGDELSFRGPLGHFTMMPKLPNHLFLICTGTGIAPFRSMIHHWKDNNISDKNIYLLMGTRTQSDLLYHSEMQELDKSLPWFNYIPTLSREQWDGKEGYVHEIYKKMVLDKPEAEFMLCGWRNMIDEARIQLASLGYGKEKIHFELYG